MCKQKKNRKMCKTLSKIRINSPRPPSAHTVATSVPKKLQKRLFTAKICKNCLPIEEISLPLRRREECMLSLWEITVFYNLIKNTNKMKKGIHPENYRLVAFKDMSNDHVFLCRSAVSTKETIEVNGETYPVYKMEISNTSHPFYTGKIKLVDTAGRVDKFMSRYAKRYDKKNK